MILKRRLIGSLLLYGGCTTTFAWMVVPPLIDSHHSHRNCPCFDGRSCSLGIDTEGSGASHLRRTALGMITPSRTPAISTAIPSSLSNYHRMTACSPLFAFSATDMASTAKASNGTMISVDGKISSGSSTTVATDGTPNKADTATLPSTTTTTTTIDADDDSGARSSFGTKEYWDEVYLGRGDFPPEEYSWYFGYEEYSKYVQEYLGNSKNNKKEMNLLIPGIGNDPVLLDLLRDGYTKLTATDYSEHAIERQIDLLSYFATEKQQEDYVDLYTMDARHMPTEWTNKYNVILEKGALDAIYLSGDGNLELAVQEFKRVLQTSSSTTTTTTTNANNQGILISVSGVIPDEVRKEVFSSNDGWEWLRDGTKDFRAGCFVFKLNTK